MHHGPWRGTREFRRLTIAALALLFVSTSAQASPLQMFGYGGRSPALASALVPGGCLVASGFLTSQIDEVAATLGAAGLATAERTTDGEWAAIVAEAVGP